MCLYAKENGSISWMRYGGKFQGKKTGGEVVAEVSLEARVRQWLRINNEVLNLVSG